MSTHITHNASLRHRLSALHAGLRAAFRALRGPVKR